MRPRGEENSSGTHATGTREGAQPSGELYLLMTHARACAHAALMGLTPDQVAEYERWSPAAPRRPCNTSPAPLLLSPELSVGPGVHAARTELLVERPSKFSTHRFSNRCAAYRSFFGSAYRRVIKSGAERVFAVELSGTNPTRQACRCAWAQKSLACRTPEPLAGTFEPSFRGRTPAREAALHDPDMALYGRGRRFLAIAAAFGFLHRRSVHHGHRKKCVAELLARVGFEVLLSA